MSETKTVLTKFHKDYGDGVGGMGVAKCEVARIPTGIFQFDLATGGGFPMGRISILYGPESCGKTTMAYLLAVYVQKVLKRNAVFIDVEGTFDAVWAEACGVDVAKVIVLTPDSAEQAVDMIEAMLYANDVGMVVVDSIAALTTTNEIESEAGKMIVGGSAMLTTKLVRKSVTALNREGKRKHHPALVCINQTRFKIGTLYGDPETTPGGNALRFASSLTVRLFGKDEYVKDVHQAMPVFKATTMTVRKWKVPIVSRQAEYQMCLLPHAHLQVGQSPSWNTVANYLKQYGVLTKGTDGWTCMGQKMKTLAMLQAKYETDGAFCQSLQSEIIKREIHVHPDTVPANVDPATGEITDA